MKKYQDIIADIAESIHLALIKDQFTRDYCVRYNESKGAYFTTDDYNDDIIILRPDRRFTAMTFPQLKADLVKTLSAQPVFPV